MVPVTITQLSNAQFTLALLLLKVVEATGDAVQKGGNNPDGFMPHTPLSLRNMNTLNHTPHDSDHQDWNDHDPDLIRVRVRVRS